MALKIIKRRAARALGLAKYYTGKPCKHNHLSERHVASAKCVTCTRRADSLRRATTDPRFTKVKRREKHLRHHYGITIEDYMRMVNEQDHRCACCGTPDQNLMVDHNHDTDKVRGLLCNNCNSMLGYALDNPRRLQLGIDYLERNG